jgi:hypothetical protein
MFGQAEVLNEDNCRRRVMASWRLQPDGKTGSTWSTDNCNMLIDMPGSVVFDASQITESVRTLSSSELDGDLRRQC